MDKQLSNFLVYRYLCFLMALHVINISIDTSDRTFLSGRATAYHKDLSSNEIESITEFVLETCLGIVDAIPEQDDPDDDAGFAGQPQDHTFTQLFVFTPLLPAVHYLTMGDRPFQAAHVSTPVSEIVAPPPQSNA